MSKDIPMESLKKKAIKDIFDLQIQIHGLEEAHMDEKYIYIEDQHAIGD